MRRTTPLYILASTFGLIACSDSPTGPVEQRPELEQPVEDLPHVPATAALAFVSTRDGHEYVYVANADGSAVTRVTEGSSPAWAQDGRRIAFVRQASRMGPAGIYVLDLDGTGPRYVGPGRYPTWSPDGRIAFSSSGRTAGPGLYAMDADGSDVMQLVDAITVLEDRGGGPGTFLANHQIIDPAWSPDGRSISFQAMAIVYEMAWLWHVPDAEWWTVSVLGFAAVDGSGPRELAVPVGDLSSQSGPAWSPDGSTIAVITHPGPWEVCDGSPGCRPGPGFGKSSRIYRYDVHSDLALAGRQLIYTAPAFLASSPDWSPDGRHVAFTGNFSPQNALSGSRIYTVSVETGELHQLVPDAIDPLTSDYSDWGVTWSRGNR